MATYSPTYSEPSTGAIRADEWWKEAALIRALALHPRAGERKVLAVLPVVQGHSSYQREARRFDVSEALVRAWKDELVRIVKRDLWQKWLQEKQVRRAPVPHPFLSYYGD